MGKGGWGGGGSLSVRPHFERSTRFLMCLFQFRVHVGLFGHGRLLGVRACVLRGRVGRRGGG